MERKQTLYLYPLGYFFLSALGFGILKHFGIVYDDPRIHFYAIPMMLVIAAFVFWVNGNDVLINKKDFKPCPAFGLLNWVPVLVILMAIVTLIEAFVRIDAPQKVLWAVILTFLIGFSEEGMFRKFIISKAEKTWAPWQVLLYSTLAFALLHMANMASGLDLTAAAIQCVYTLPFGLLAGFLYMETRNITALVFWHMSVDYSLFLSELADFRTATYFGYAIDLLLFLTTLWLLLKRGQRFLQNKRVSH